MNEAPYIFAVDERGDIYYNKNKLPLDKALRTAEAAKKEAPQANIVVQVDRETPAFAVEELIDTVRPCADSATLYLHG